MTTTDSASADSAQAPVRGGRLEVDSLRKVYGGEDGVVVIDSLTFDIKPGEAVTIVGPSGVGKSTLLKCLSGLLTPTSGQVCFDDQIIRDEPPIGMSFVFQDYTRSLFPWYTVQRNVALPLRNQGVSKRDAIERARAALDAVGLKGRYDLYPWQMSGGMQQRVAIARGLVVEPELLLMDEPFASVDAQTRADLEDLTLKVHRDFGVTLMLVTHDVDEAVYLADRVIVLAGPPCVLRDVVEVPLPRPRDQIATKSDPRFTDIRGKIIKLIKRPEPAS